MGSTGIQVLIAAFLTLTPFASPLKGDGQMKTVFQTRAEVKVWADAFFWGGHEIVELSNGNAEALVVIGSHSGGVPSSETYVFCKTKEKQFKLILMRSAVAGILKAHATAEGIEIRTQKNKAILVVPWHGVAEEFDYFPDTRR